MKSYLKWYIQPIAHTWLNKIEKKKNPWQAKVAVNILKALNKANSFVAYENHLAVMEKNPFRQAKCVVGNLLCNRSFSFVPILLQESPFR